MFSKVNLALRLVALIAMNASPLVGHAKESNLRLATKAVSRTLQATDNANPCDNRTCHPWATCTADSLAPRGYICTCPPGSNGNGLPENFKDGTGCKAQNECELKDDDWPCPQPGGFCVDRSPLDPVVPMYMCGCQEGYNKTESDDYGRAVVCEEIPCFRCSSNASCNITNGAYTCECSKGFEGDGFDCTANVDPGDPATTAPKDPCASCDPVSQVCSADHTRCDCAPGYFHPSGQGGVCHQVLVDDCAEGACDDNAICIDIPGPGSHLCICDEGWRGSGYPGRCEDIDECEEEFVNCPEGSYCVNTPGTFSCVAKAGFVKLENGTFVDENECESTPSICDCTGLPSCSYATNKATCVNTEGSYRCECPIGYHIQDAFGDKVCFETNQCIDGSHDCTSSQRCVNIVGVNSDGKGWKCEAGCIPGRALRGDGDQLHRALEPPPCN